MKCSFICLLLLSIMAGSCRKDLKRMMVVTTDSISKMDSTIFITGTVIDAGEGINNYGHCWSLNKLPVISDDTSSYGSLNHSGNFQSALKNLKKGQKYYVRSYAKHNNEIIYGNTLDFVYDNSSVSIGPAIQLNSDTILVSSTITTGGLDKPIKYGYCWKEGNTLPDISNSDTIAFNSIMPLYTAIKNFKEGTKYSIRSFAIYNSGTVYSNNVDTITTGSRIFWNRLGSAYQLQQQTPGTEIRMINYLISDWGEADTVPAKFGKGLYINKGTTDVFSNNGANFFTINTHDIKLAAKCGTIEFWFIFKCSSAHVTKAYFFDFANKFTGHFSTNVTNSNMYLSGGWNNWDPAEAYFFFTIKDAATDREVTIKSRDIQKFNINDTCHFAFTWDINGIGGSQDKMRIYKNGRVIASDIVAWDATEPLDPYMYLGAKSGSDYDQTDIEVKGITDNLKIYNFAKVSYSDREIEDKR